MLIWVLLIMMALWFYFALRNICRRKIAAIEREYSLAQAKYDKLKIENVRLKDDNISLEGNLKGVIALYDVTKEICKSLDFDQVFKLFRQQLAVYTNISDCQFLKEAFDPLKYADYVVIPVKIDNMIVGSLVVKIVSASDKDKFYVLAQQLILVMKRAVLYQKVQELSITDKLTDVFTRNYFMERLKEEIKRSAKLKNIFAFLMIDIDYFKKYNDSYGHLVGDAVLKDVARTIKESVRQVDFVGRYGGEEFAVIFTETDRNQAQFAAERIRRAVADRRIKTYDEELLATISIGICFFPENGKDVRELIDKADSALYQAKNTGRNRICFA